MDSSTPDPIVAATLAAESSATMSVSTHPPTVAPSNMMKRSFARARSMFQAAGRAPARTTQNLNGIEIATESSLLEAAATLHESTVFEFVEEVSVQEVDLDDVLQEKSTPTAPDEPPKSSASTHRSSFLMVTAKPEIKQDPESSTIHVSIPVRDKQDQESIVSITDHEFNQRKKVFAVAANNRALIFRALLWKARLMPYITWLSSLVSTVSSFNNYSYDQSKLGQYGRSELAAILGLTILKCVADCFGFYYQLKRHFLKVVDTRCTSCGCSESCRQGYDEMADCDASIYCDPCAKCELECCGDDEEGKSLCQCCFFCCTIPCCLLSILGNCNTSQLSGEDEAAHVLAKRSLWKMASDLLNIGVILCNVRILASLRVAGVFRDWQDAANASPDNYVRSLYIALVGSAVSLVAERSVSFIFNIWDKWVEATNAVDVLIRARSVLGSGMKSSATVVPIDERVQGGAGSSSVVDTTASASAAASAHPPPPPPPLKYVVIKRLRRFWIEWATVSDVGQITYLNYGPYMLHQLICVVNAFSLLRVSYDMLSLAGTKSSYDYYALNSCNFVLILFVFNICPAYLDAIPVNYSYPENSWMYRFQLFTGISFGVVSFLVLLLAIISAAIVQSSGLSSPYGDSLFAQSMIVALVFSSMGFFVHSVLVNYFAGNCCECRSCFEICDGCCECSCCSRSDDDDMDAVKCCEVFMTVIVGMFVIATFPLWGPFYCLCHPDAECYAGDCCADCLQSIVECKCDPDCDCSCDNCEAPCSSDNCCTSDSESCCTEVDCVECTESVQGSCENCSCEGSGNSDCNPCEVCDCSEGCELESCSIDCDCCEDYEE